MLHLFAHPCCTIVHAWYYPCKDVLCLYTYPLCSLPSMYFTNICNQTVKTVKLSNISSHFQCVLLEGPIKSHACLWSSSHLPPTIRSIPIYWNLHCIALHAWNHPWKYMSYLFTSPLCSPGNWKPDKKLRPSMQPTNRQTQNPESLELYIFSLNWSTI